jgi:hypothetical protein
MDRLALAKARLISKASAASAHPSPLRAGMPRLGAGSLHSTWLISAGRSKETLIDAIVEAKKGTELLKKAMAEKATAAR